MGTFSDSRIVKARHPYQCANGMDHAINKGELYLRYKLGLRNDIMVCLRCATSKMEERNDKQPYYDCAALRDHINIAAGTSAATPSV